MNFDDSWLKGKCFMNKKVNLRKVLFVLVACLVASLMFSMTVSARDFVEVDRACTLDLTYKYEETCFEGVEIKIYKVASFNVVGEYELAGDFADYAIDVVNVKSQDEWNALSDTLAAYVAADSLVPTKVATTGADGVASFTEIEVGLYLVSGAVTTYIDDGTIHYDDFLISVPGLDDEENWIYDIDSVPKPVYHEPVYEEIEYSVVKLWKDAGYENKRPEGINVDIMKDGELVESIVLTAENNWSYSWIGLDDGSVWQVVERDVPEAYTVTFEQKDFAFMITNTYIPEEPPTGDSFNAVPYIVAMCVSGALLIVLGVIKSKKDSAEA